MRRFLAIILCLAMCLTLLPAAAADEIRVIDTAEDEDLIPVIDLQNLDTVETEGGVVANEATGKRIAFKWNAQSGASLYAVSRKVDDGEDETFCFTTNTNCVDEDILMGKSYTYNVFYYTSSWNSLGYYKKTPYNPFTDVPNSGKTLEYIAWAYNNGIVTGTSDTTFSPDKRCSRIQFVMMLWKMNGSPEVSGKNPFSDISGTKTTKAILWALKAGVINSAKKFNPDDEISRVQIVMILWKFAGSPEISGTCPFKDVKGEKTKKAVVWAYKKGITKGTSDTTFAPDKPCTREQLVTFLYKYNNTIASPVTYRALLVGEVHFSWETATRNEGDVNLISDMLVNVKGPKGGNYNTTSRLDCSNNGIKHAIEYTFAYADDNDVSLFFLATHGVVDVATGPDAGAVVTIEIPGVYDDQLQLGELAGWLKKVPGKVIVVLGSCGSGAAIVSNNGELSYVPDVSAEADALFNDAVIQAFAAEDELLPNDEEEIANTGEFRSSKFYVLTAAAHQESSWGSEYYHYNYFPYYFAKGANTGKPADADGNGTITLNEMYKYVYKMAYGPYNSEYYQHAQVYPTNSSYALFK